MTKLLLSLCTSAVLIWAVSPADAADQYVFRNGRWVRLTEPVGGAELAGVRDLIGQGKYGAAIRSANQIIKDPVDEATELAARMLVGDCWLLSDEMTDARLAYDAVLERAPADSDLMRQVLEREYELSWQWVVGGRKRKVKVLGIYLPLIKIAGADEGLQLMADIRLRGRDDLRVRTLMLAAEYHYGRSEFDEAEILYKQVQGFPNFTDRETGKSFALTAELQRANCLIGQFRGTAYDLSRLDRAQRGLKDFARAHLSEARSADVPVLIESIDWTKARRDFDTARFYDRMGNTRSAVWYYRMIRDTYAGTPWRDRAIRRLSDLGAEDTERP